MPTWFLLLTSTTYLANTPCRACARLSRRFVPSHSLRYVSGSRSIIGTQPTRVFWAGKHRGRNRATCSQRRRCRVASLGRPLDPRVHPSVGEILREPRGCQAAISAIVGVRPYPHLRREAQVWVSQAQEAGSPGDHADHIILYVAAVPEHCERVRQALCHIYLHEPRLFGELEQAQTSPKPFLVSTGAPCRAFVRAGVVLEEVIL